MVLGMLLKVACSLWPGLADGRRITLGLVGVAIGISTTLIKIPLYDEPEGVIFLIADAVLLTLLLLSRRPGRDQVPVPSHAGSVDAA